MKVPTEMLAAVKKVPAEKRAQAAKLAEQTYFKFLARLKDPVAAASAAAAEVMYTFKIHRK